jgi:hypothetical protein
MPEAGAKKMNELKQYLEELMDERRLCSIKFRGENGGLASIHTRILELDYRDGTDYLVTEEGLEISFDSLEEVNGRAFKGLC